MRQGFYAITEYCSVHHIDPSFIHSLRNEGLIVVISENDEDIIEEEQLHDLEVYTRLYAELGVNTEGIDVIRHLLQKVKDIQTEMNQLRNRLSVYEPLSEGDA